LLLEKLQMRKKEQKMQQKLLQTKEMKKKELQLQENLQMLQKNLE
jgi:hypothetical protein